MIKCTVEFPHSREINGKLLMFEPILSGIVDLPNDDRTHAAIDAGWLKPIKD